MKQKFPLLLIKVTFNLRLKLILQLKDLDLLYKELKKHKSPVTYIVYFQKLLLVLNLYVSIGTYKVDKISIVLDVLYGKSCFGTYIRIYLYDLEGKIFEGPDYRIEVFALFFRFFFRNGSDFGYKVRIVGDQFAEYHSFPALYYGSGRTIRHFKQLDDLSDGTDLMKVGKSRILLIRILLGNCPYYFIGPVSIFYQLYGTWPAY